MFLASFYADLALPYDEGETLYVGLAQQMSYKIVRKDVSFKIWILSNLWITFG